MAPARGQGRAARSELGSPLTPGAQEGVDSTSVHLVPETSLFPWGAVSPPLRALTPASPAASAGPPVPGGSRVSGARSCAVPSPLGGWGRSGSQKAHRPEGSTPPATTGVTAAIDQLQASPPPPPLTPPPPPPPAPRLGKTRGERGCPCHRPETPFLRDGSSEDDWSARLRRPHSLLPVSVRPSLLAPELGRAVTPHHVLQGGTRPGPRPGPVSRWTWLGRGVAGAWQVRSGVEHALPGEEEGKALHLVVLGRRRPRACEHLFLDEPEGGGVSSWCYF